MLDHLGSRFDYIFDVLKHDIIAGDLRMGPLLDSATGDGVCLLEDAYRFETWKKDHEESFLLLKALNVSKHQYHVGFKLTTTKRGADVIEIGCFGADR